MRLKTYKSKTTTLEKKLKVITQLEPDKVLMMLH